MSNSVVKDLLEIMSDKKSLESLDVSSLHNLIKYLELRDILSLSSVSKFLRKYVKFLSLDLSGASIRLSHLTEFSGVSGITSMDRLNVTFNCEDNNLNPLIPFLGRLKELILFDEGEVERKMPLAISEIARAKTLQKLTLRMNGVDLSALFVLNYLRYLSLIDFPNNYNDVKIMDNLYEIFVTDKFSLLIIKSRDVAGPDYSFRETSKLRLGLCDNPRIIDSSKEKALAINSVNDITSIPDIFLRFLTNENLTYVSLFSCLNLRDISALKQCPNIHHLDVSGCPFLEDISPVVELTELKCLDLSGCVRIRKLDLLLGLTNIRELYLDDLFNLEDLGFLANFSLLNTLSICGCLKITKVEPFSGCFNLSNFSFDGRTEITDFNFLSRCKKLKTIGISYIQDISNSLMMKRLVILFRILSIESIRHGGAEYFEEESYLRIYKKFFDELAKYKQFNTNMTGKRIIRDQDEHR